MPLWAIPNLSGVLKTLVEIQTHGHAELKSTPATRLRRFKMGFALPHVPDLV